MRAAAALCSLWGSTWEEKACWKVKGGSAPTTYAAKPLQEASLAQNSAGRPRVLPMLSAVRHTCARAQRSAALRLQPGLFCVQHRAPVGCQVEILC